MSADNRIPTAAIANTAAMDETPFRRANNKIDDT
jgi:hypothetical protein